MVSMDNNLVGQTIQGRYYVVRQLGRGGVGVTFLAQDRQCFDSPCVVKQLKPKTANSQTLVVARRLFEKEAEIMNCLGHCDRIPRLLANFEQDNEFFLVQELIEGHDLSQEILPGKPWSEAETIALLQDSLEVLQVVQEHNVIHRDLKPSNLMRRNQDNKIIIIDFGSVKQVSTQVIDAAGEQRQTVAVGTRSYMPIEQIMGSPGFYSDIYALGIIAIQALTGVNPEKLEIDDDGEILWRNRLDNVNYQPRFLDLLDRMVRYRYQERYKSAKVVLSDLRRLDAAQNNEETIIVDRNNFENRQPPPQTPELRSDTNKETAVINNRSQITDSSINSTTVITNRVYPQTPVESQAAESSGFKALPVVVAVAIALTGLGSWILISQRSNEPEIELSSYESQSEGFRIDYPQDWSKQERNDFFATGVIFFSPLVDDADRFKEKVSLLVENIPNNMSLEAYTDQSLAEIRKLSDPDIKKAQKITLGSNEARQIVYRGEENGQPVRRMQVWSVKGDRAYVLTYTATPQDYDLYLPMVEKTIESFETIK